MAKKVFEVAMILSASDKASRVINSAAANAERRIKSLSGIGDRAFGIGRGAGALGIAIAAPLGLAVKAAEDSEIANRRLEKTFRTMGETTDKAANSAEAYADKLQMQIGVEDEDIKMVQSKIATFRKVSDETARMSGVFDRATAAAFDLAAGGFGEASQNAVLLGKALQDPMRGAAALSRTGALNKADVPLIKQIQLTKGLGAAQEYVLKAVERQVKGQAANTATSASKMKVTFAEVAETLGKTLLPTVQKTMKQIGDVANRFNKWAGDNPKLLSTIVQVIGGIGVFSLAVSGLAFAFGGVAKAVSGAMYLYKAYQGLMVLMQAAQTAYTFTLLGTGSGFAAVSAGLKAMNLAFLTSPIFWIVAGIAALAYVIIKNWKPITEFFGRMWTGIKNVWAAAPAWFGKLWGTLKTLTWNGIKFFFFLPVTFAKLGVDIISGLWNGLKAKATALFGYVKEIGHKIAGAFKSVLGIASPSKVFMEFGTNITEGASKGIQKGSGALVNSSKSMGQKITPKSGRGGGGSMSVTFAPVISGGGNAQDIAAEIKKLFPQFMRELENKLDRKARLSF